MLWLKEWITLRNKEILYLEGYDLQLGWHAFLWYEKAKIHKYFQNHAIRNVLLSEWEKVRHKLYMKSPERLSTMEAFAYPNLINYDKLVSYKDILDKDGKLKDRQALQQEGIDLTWWSYLQIQTRYEKDIKIMGVYKELIPLDKILLRTFD